MSCHSLSSAPAAAANRCVIGIGTGRPSRRATETAVASTAEESRPPEKLTRQGDRSSAGRIAASSAARGVVPGSTGGSFGSLPGSSSTTPLAISSGVSARGEVPVTMSAPGGGGAPGTCSGCASTVSSHAWAWKPLLGPMTPITTSPRAPWSASQRWRTSARSRQVLGRRRTTASTPTRAEAGSRGGGVTRAPSSPCAARSRRVRRSASDRPRGRPRLDGASNAGIRRARASTGLRLTLVREMRGLEIARRATNGSSTPPGFRACAPGDHPGHRGRRPPPPLRLGRGAPRREPRGRGRRGPRDPRSQRRRQDHAHAHPLRGRGSQQRIRVRARPPLRPLARAARADRVRARPATAPSTCACRGSRTSSSSLACTACAAAPRASAPRSCWTPSGWRMRRAVR